MFANAQNKCFPICIIQDDKNFSFNFNRKENQFFFFVFFYTLIPGTEKDIIYIAVHKL